MKRIHMHWTAGTHRPNAADRKPYHFLIDGDGDVTPGLFKPEDNIRCVPGKYAAHTYRANTGAIGVAVCAMHGAKEIPFDPGSFPITAKQVDALVKTVATLAMKYGIPVTPETILTHAEVQDNLGIPQRGKWDITWLPGFRFVHPAREVGDKLRDQVEFQISEHMKDEQEAIDPPKDHVPTPRRSWFRRMVGGRNR